MHPLPLGSLVVLLPNTEFYYQFEDALTRGCCPYGRITETEYLGDHEDYEDWYVIEFFYPNGKFFDSNSYPYEHVVPYMGKMPIHLLPHIDSYY